jgi:hypothetical protein
LARCAAMTPRSPPPLCFSTAPLLAGGYGLRTNPEASLSHRTRSWITTVTIATVTVPGPCAQRGSATSGDKLIEPLRNAAICQSARAAGDRGSFMLRKEAEREIIREWMSLPEGERQTEHQAAQFALRMKRKYPFDYTGSDRYQRRMKMRSNSALETRRGTGRPCSQPQCAVSACGSLPQHAKLSLR